MSLFLISNSFALECPMDRKLKDIALDLIKVELSGVRDRDLEDSQCLKQSEHKYVKVIYDPLLEEDSSSKYIIENVSDIKILKVYLTNINAQSYKVKYMLEGKTLKGKKYNYTNQLEFILYKQKQDQKLYGCAAVIEPPEKISIFRKCI